MEKNGKTYFYWNDVALESCLHCLEFLRVMLCEVFFLVVSISEMNLVHFFVSLQFFCHYSCIATSRCTAEQIVAIVDKHPTVVELLSQ